MGGGFVSVYALIGIGILEGGGIFVCMLQQPGEHPGIAVGVAPGIVRVVRVYRQTGIAAAAVDGVHHFFALLREHHLILAAVEGPHRHVHQPPGVPVHPAAADGGDGGKVLRQTHGQLPGAVATHAGPHPIQPRFVHEGQGDGMPHQVL